MIKFMALASLLYSFSLFYFLKIIITLLSTKTNCTSIGTMPLSSDFQPQATSPSNIDNVAMTVEEAPVLLKALQKVPYRLLGKPEVRLTKKVEGGETSLPSPREEYKGKIDDPDVENKVNKNLRGVSTFPHFARSFGPYAVNLGFGSEHPNN